MKKWISLFLTFILTVCLAACSAKTSAGETGTETTPAAEIDTADMFTDRDFEIGYDEETSTYIYLNGGTAECNSQNVQISGSTITITAEGTYILSGSLTDGSVIVDAPDNAKLQIVLNGAEITSATSAALYVREADKVFVTTAADTENTLQNGGEYEAIDGNNIDAAVFSKADLTLNGAGTLNVTAKSGHGIVSKDDLAVTCGSYSITSASHGLSGKDSVRIAGGTLQITAGKDGIQAENDEDTSLGFLYMAGGTLEITAEGDGMSASSSLQIDGGTITVQSGGGAAAVETQSMQNFLASQTDDQTDTTSMKGLKAASSLTVNDGTYTIDAADDALHTDGDLTVNGGDYTIASGDDGMHADGALQITGGTINITESYEGIEGQTIDISGGDITLVASDDGLNAAGGNNESGTGGPFGGRGDDFSADENTYITIRGGKLQIDAAGDGIDSNGDLTVSGGETYVCGPTDGGNGALDYGGDAVITGGIFVAAGASQMAQNFGSDSTQGAMLVSLSSQQAGSTVKLCDSSGQSLLQWTAQKAFDSILISMPEITSGATYTLTTADAQTEITMSSLLYSSTDGSMNGGAPSGGNMHGGSLGDQTPQRP